MNYFTSPTIPSSQINIGMFADTYKVSPSVREKKINNTINLWIQNFIVHHEYLLVILLLSIYCYFIIPILKLKLSRTAFFMS